MCASVWQLEDSHAFKTGSLADQELTEKAKLEGSES